MRASPSSSHHGTLAASAVWEGYLGSLKSAMENGAISGRYLTGIKARILLMVALAKTKDRKELADIFARA